MILNERILRLVVTLAEELHFHRAADRLNLSQPALSGTVKSVEAELGVRLFRRTHRNVDLTAAGEVFVAEARRLLDEASAAVALVRQSSTGPLAPLRVGYTAAIDLTWLWRLVACLRTTARFDTEIELVSADSSQLRSELIRGTLHAAFFAAHEAHPGLRFSRLFRQPFAFACAAAHPLAACRSVSLTQLADSPLAWLRRESDPALYDSFLSTCLASGYHPKVSQHVASFHECLQFAREGLGIALVPAFLRTEAACDGVAFADLPENFLHLEYSLGYRAEPDSAPALHFARLVQKRFSCPPPARIAANE